MFALQLQQILTQGSVWDKNFCEVTEKVFALVCIKAKIMLDQKQNSYT
jgi:hypothetical protein